MARRSEKLKVLVSLHKGYGIGDAVQVSAVLRHLKKYRSNWSVDFQAEIGKSCIGRDLTDNQFAFGDPYPSRHYDAEAEILLFDTWANWGDRPNTRVSSCLHERFNLGWDSDCGRYHVTIRKESADAAKTLLHSGKKDAYNKIVAVHYEGVSSPTKKNLTHAQADEICKEIIRLGYEPLILDWLAKSPLIHRRLRSPKHWGMDIEMICAVIDQCCAFVGIDSGPSKCASATNTPALVTWTGHHPAPFHDPAPNTTHLVPQGYHGLEPVCNDKGVIEWFEKHYSVIKYEKDPVVEIRRWLCNILK